MHIPALHRLLLVCYLYHAGLSGRTDTVGVGAMMTYMAHMYVESTIHPSKSPAIHL